jgi:flagellar hook assembly protein FlgD
VFLVGDEGVILKSGTIGTGVRPGVPTPAFALRQNVPNPFSETTTIQFDLDVAQPVTVRVYDVTGRLVDTVTQATLPAGMNEVRWTARSHDGTQLRSGVYFYTVTTPRGTQSRKMLVLR